MAAEDAMGIKDGVKLEGIAPEMAVALTVIQSVFLANGLGGVTITSGKDGQHKVGSLHYRGRALDIRTRNLKPEAASEIGHKIALALGREYDVVKEPDHIHCEFQPK